MVVLQTLTAVLLLATCTLALGPPPGSAGTLDFRYPDYIVQPLVSCPFEGVFPHPHDCTWYYRCYDRYGLGHYWRAYFQCEPGTVFSDLLDQCIWQGDNVGCASDPVGLPTGPIVLPPPDSTSSITPTPPPPPPCQESFSDCKETKLCPLSDSGTAFIVTAEICHTTTRSCLGYPAVPFCPAGQVWDNTNRRCIPENALCRPLQDRPAGSDVICADQLSGCRDYTVCQGRGDPKLHRLCHVSKNCYHKQGYNSSQSLCEGGLLFNAFTNQCVQPFAPEDACPGNALVMASDVPCIQETETCSVFTSCETREQFLGCSSFFVCGANTPRSSVCSHDQVFVARFGSCIPLANMGVTERQVTGGVYSPCMFTGLSTTTTTIPAPTPAINPLPTPTPTLITSFTTAPTTVPTLAPTPVIDLFSTSTPTLTTVPTIAPTTAATTTATTPALTPTPTTTLAITTTTTTPAPTAAPTDIHTYISNYKCEMNGGRPYAEGHNLLGCSPRQYCNQLGVPAGAMVGCTGFFECQPKHKRLEIFHRRCRPGQFYFFGEVNACGESSTFGLYDCPIPTPAPPPVPITESTTTTTTTTTPAPTPPPNPVDVVFNIVVTCTREGEIPTMPENAARLYCSNRALCSDGQYQGQQNTCEKYYHCVKDDATGRLSSLLRECDIPGQRFDQIIRACITPKTNFCGSLRFSLYPGFDSLTQTPTGFYSHPLSESPSQTSFGTNQANALEYNPQTQTWPQQSHVGVPYQNPSLFGHQTPIAFNQHRPAPNTQFGLLNTLDGSQQGPFGFNTPAAGGYVQQNPARFGSHNRPIGFGHSNHL